jgi:lysophospholipase L1-like esterase
MAPVMNEQEDTWKRLLPWGLRLVAWGFFAVGSVCILLTTLIFLRGRPWAYIVYAERPISHLLGGIGALFAWYLLLYGIHNTRQNWKRFAGRVLLATFSLLLSLIVAELGLRMFYSARQKANSLDRLKTLRREGKPPPVRSTHPLAIIIQPSEYPKVVYELQPNLDMEFGNRLVRTNQQGIREDREYPAARAPNSVRIVGIGDSGMFGWNMEQNDDYMTVMETNLNNRHEGVLYEVLNMAVPGYNTQLEVETLRAKGLAYQPDVVIVGWCENDFSLPFFLLEKENYKRRDISFLYNLLFKRTVTFTEVAPGFTLHDQREYDKNKVTPELMTGTDEEGVRTALKDLRQMSEKTGFKVLVFGPMGSLIRQLCDQEKIPYASTYDMIPEGKYPKSYLLFYMHPSQDGHRVLAEYLERELDRRGWLVPSP